MKWIPLTPRHIAKPPESGRVSFALVPAKGPNGSTLTRLNMSRVIPETLGWEPKMVMALQYSEDTAWLHIAPAAEGVEGYTLSLRDTTATVSCRLPWLFGRQEGHPAETTHYELVPEDRAIMVAVPPWARQPAPALTAEEAAALAEREAKDALRAGESVRSVAARLDEDLATVQRWKREVMEGQAEAA